MSPQEEKDLLAAKLEVYDAAQSFVSLVGITLTTSSLGCQSDADRVKIISNGLATFKKVQDRVFNEHCRKYPD